MLSLYVKCIEKKETDKLFHPSPQGVAKTANKPSVVLGTCKHYVKCTCDGNFLPGSLCLTLVGN